MEYISLFSGIEAASIAWKGLDWEPVVFSEIDKFASAVLQHHFPDIPNLGDITKVDWSEYRGKVDLVCGGPPCQNFSIAGKRESMEGKVGGLSLEYAKAIHAIKPVWFIAENVPGILSAKGNAFGRFLSALVGTETEFLPSGKRWTDAGIVSGEEYSIAWRILDAQYFGVPQRRKRVWIVGYRGDWRYPAKVLFESQSVSRNFETGREKKDKNPREIGHCLTAHGPSHSDITQETYIVQSVFQHINGSFDLSNIKNTLTTNTASASGRNHQLLLLPDRIYDMRGYGDGNICPTITRESAGDRPGLMTPMVVHATQSPISGTVSPALSANARMGISLSADKVRRITPEEAEKLQGFPAGWTKIPWRGKNIEDCPDGLRYKAIGNSWAVPCIKWVAERIGAVENVRLNPQFLAQ